MANYYNQNQSIINQLLRQKDNIDEMLEQYSKPPAPVQNIINTGVADFEARILQDGEEVANIFVSKRTMFLDKKNKKIMIKETNGEISEEYEIVIPLDEKDKKIIELESKLKEMEGKINEYTKSIRADDEQYKSNANANGHDNSATKTNGEPVQKSDKTTTSGTNSEDVQWERHNKRAVGYNN